MTTASIRNVQCLLRQQLLALQRPPSRVRTDLGVLADRVDAIVTKALTKEPEGRYPCMQDMREAFRELAAASERSGPSEVELPPPSEVRARQEARRRERNDERKELATLLERGDIREVSLRVARLRLREGEQLEADSLSLTNDASRLAPVVETLLARDLLPSRSVTAFLAYRGSIIASALWTARIGVASRPADVKRRWRFIAWMKLIGRPAHGVLRAALAELQRRSADDGGANEIACTEDVLRCLPAMPDDDLREAAALFASSSAASVRRLARARVR